MTSQLNGKIFLAEERRCNESEWYRSYQTFCFENYINEHKMPFENLHVLNDETLAAGRHMHIEVEEETYVILLPIVGTIAYKIDNTTERLITAGQLFIICLNKNSALDISNPYTDELINFLQIRCMANARTKDSYEAVFSFDLDKHENALIPVIKTFGNDATEKQLPLVSIGKFKGRQEDVYQLKNPESLLFVFVFEGVFEVQGRLLHSRDGLGLWSEAQEIELEALSNDAIIMLLEVGKP